MCGPGNYPPFPGPSFGPGDPPKPGTRYIELVKKRTLLMLLCAFSISSSIARAEQRVQYAAPTKDFAQVYSGGPAPLMVMHEDGHTYTETETSRQASPQE